MPTGNYEKANPDLIKRIKKSEDISEENKKVLIGDSSEPVNNPGGYYRDLELYDEIGPARIYKILQHLKVVAENIDYDLSNTNKEKIENIKLWLKQRDLAPATVRDYNVVLKQFFKWLENDLQSDEYPDYTKILSTTLKDKEEKMPKDLLKESEVKELIKHANHPRDKALISMLWESGARIGELIDLKFRDLEDHKHGNKLNLKGKTGERQVLLIGSIPYLQTWRNAHPDGENKDAWIWVNIGNVNNGEKMRYRTIRKMLEETKKRAGVDKNVNPHQFRHSRLTHLVAKQGFGEYQLCQFAGWKMGSEQAQTYLHLSGKDLDSTLLKAHGIDEEDEEEHQSLFTPEKCPRCEASVPSEAKYCPRCSQALTEDAMDQPTAEDINTYLKSDDFKKDLSSKLDSVGLDEQTRKNPESVDLSEDEVKKLKKLLKTID